MGASGTVGTVELASRPGAAAEVAAPGKEFVEHVAPGDSAPERDGVRVEPSVSGDESEERSRLELDEAPVAVWSDGASCDVAGGSVEVVPAACGESPVLVDPLVIAPSTGSTAGATIVETAPWTGCATCVTTPLTTGVTDDATGSTTGSTAPATCWVAVSTVLVTVPVGSTAPTEPTAAPTGPWSPTRPPTSPPELAPDELDCRTAAAAGSVRPRRRSPNRRPGE